MCVKDLIESCQNVSLKIFKSHSGNKNVDFIERDCPSDVDLIQWKSFIFLGGTKFRFMFETEFSTITLLGLATNKFTDVQESDYIENVKDFMREYCNLVAGKIKAAFEKETDAYLSLPIISKDYNVENLFSVETDKINRSSWSFGENKMKININLYYYEKEQFENYDFVKNHLEQISTSGNVEFF
jgi:hypothetical protein